MVTYGNLKLPQNCMIFNMNPAIECPSAKLGLCKLSKECYARQAERQYPNTLAFRYRQERFFNDMHDYELAGYFMGNIYAKATLKHPVTEIRFSEAGDFEDQTAVNKLTRAFYTVNKKCPDVKIYGYTAREDLCFDDLREVAVVNGSGFMLDNNFKAVMERDVNENLPLCPEDCANCMLCKESDAKTIQTIIR
jgi:hypothetical protein